MKKPNRRQLFVAFLAILIVWIMLFIEYLLEVNNNRKMSEETSTILMNNVIQVLEKNEATIQKMTDQLKEDYIGRARIAAYVLDSDSSLMKDSLKLKKIAEEIKVDEIHIFDKKGRIVYGSVEEYIGFAFDSGEQIKFFKPALNDYSYAKCQDVMPNSAEKKSMMYALVWDEKKQFMVQVGIEPLRLLSELQLTKVSNVVESFPAYDGTKIIVIDKENQLIEGSTDSSCVGKTVKEIGLTDYDIKRLVENDSVFRFRRKIGGEYSYCMLQSHNGRVIAIFQSFKSVNRNVISSVVIAGIYLTLALLALIFVITKMYKLLKIEEEKACVDKLTGFFNRRGFEEDVAKFSAAPVAEDMVFVSMDLNGLKVTNDTYGHDAGDQFIKKCAECMNQCFGSYGKLYRVGGDEFAAMVFVEKEKIDFIQKDFEGELKKKSESVELSVSCGFACKKDFPYKTIKELSKIADSRMYDAKQEYYRTSGHDRRGDRYNPGK